MSQASSPSPGASPALLRPEVLLGAATPLWGYFAAAALTGAAWWWMSQWMRPLGLGAADGPVAQALMGDEDAPFPVGGEAAPFGPAVLEAELIADPGLAAELIPEPAAGEGKGKGRRGRDRKRG